jgi:hypothetical protein
MIIFNVVISFYNKYRDDVNKMSNFIFSIEKNNPRPTVYRLLYLLFSDYWRAGLQQFKLTIGRGYTNTEMSQNDA